MEMVQPTSNRPARVLIMKTCLTVAPGLHFELEAQAQRDKVSLGRAHKGSERQSGSSESVARVTAGAELTQYL